MPFTKGQSGNPSGRQKATPEQKARQERFRSLLCASTVGALKTIISIAQGKTNKDRFNACKYIIDKAYGTNPALPFEIAAEQSPIAIRIVPVSTPNNNSIDNTNDWEVNDNEQKKTRRPVR